MVKYKKKGNSKSGLYGGGNTCSLKKPIEINYNLQPSTDNFFLYATPVMKRLLRDIHALEEAEEEAYHKKVCELLDLYNSAAAGLAYILPRNGSKHSTDFVCRYPGFDSYKKRHQIWLLTSLMPGEIRAMIAMQIQYCS
tara:strand:+ start:319 stop:735 length:417 start_codon:yes stop_codon:yes gene_type:complete